MGRIVDGWAKTLIGLAIGLGSVAGSLPAEAQQAADSASTVAKDSPLQEIVVTANKREQNLNDVGLTVDVVSGQALQDQQINSLSDLAQTIPGLTYSDTALGTPVYTLRGVGFYEGSLGAYPAVSVYLDEVPLSFPALTTHSAFDLERVEVLKGPQGTLFGQNATGGALNFIAAKPTKTFDAGATLSYGRFNDVVLDDFVSGPLSDTLQARVATHIERADGWQQSNSRPGDTNGSVRDYAGRAQLAFEPSQSVRFRLDLNGWIDKSQTEAPQYIGLQPQNPLIEPALAASQFSPHNPRAADWTPGLPFSDNRLWQTSLRADFDLTQRITLTSLTGYVDYKQNQAEEGDGLPLSTLDIPLDQGSIKSVSQELRVANGSASALRWVAGANYEHSEVDQTLGYNITDSTAHTTLGTVLGYPISFPTPDALQKMTNYAFFGNLEGDVTDTITLKGGVRYTDEKRSISTCNKTTSGLPGDAGPFFYNVLLGGAFGPYVNGDCFAINDLGMPVGGVAPGAPGAYNGTLKEDNVSWRTGIDWKPQPGLLLYLNVAKGYKAGSYPTVSASTFTQYLPVTQESILAYEAGIKNSLFDKKLQINAAVFYYDYKDKQLRSKIDAPPFGILDVLQNVPKSKVKGAELEITARPIPHLAISTSFTYLDATIDEFIGYNTVGALTNFAGSRVPFTPKYQFGANLDYDFPLAAGYGGFLGAGVTYRSDTVAVIGGDTNPPNVTTNVSGPVFRIDGYALVDLRAGVKLPDEKWRFFLWGKNVINKYYWNDVTAGDAISRYAGKPATFGITAEYRH